MLPHLGMTAARPTCSSPEKVEKSFGVMVILVCFIKKLNHPLLRGASEKSGEFAMSPAQVRVCVPKPLQAHVGDGCRGVSRDL